MSGDAERLQAIEQSIAGERARSEDAGINLAHLKAGVTVTEGQWLLERLRAVESQRDQALAENERLRHKMLTEFTADDLFDVDPPSRKMEAVVVEGERNA